MINKSGDEIPFRCSCCPCGFHIDLGFVKFAEDVTTGKEQIQNWSNVPNAKRTRLMSPPPNSNSIYSKNEQFYTTHYSLNPERNNQWTYRNNTEGNTIIFSPKTTLKKQTRKFSPSTVKFSLNYDNSHRDLTHSPHFDRPSRIQNFENQLFKQNHPQQKSYVKQYEKVTSPRTWFSIKPEKNNKDNFIFKNELNNDFIGNKNEISTSNFRDIKSAPTSPIPNKFRTAVAQSMLQLKNLPATTNTSKIMNTEQRECKRTLKTNEKNEKKYPSRILSPELKLTSSVTPSSQMMVRSNNLQSRSYFYNSNNTTMSIFAENKENNSSHYNKCNLSPSLFNLHSFASVRRSKSRDAMDNRNLSGQGFSVPRNKILTENPIPHTAFQPYSQGPYKHVLSSKIAFELDNNHKNLTKKPADIDACTETLPLQTLIYKPQLTADACTETLSLQSLIDKSFLTCDACTETLPFASLKKPLLAMEFQFCLGHEPEFLNDDARYLFAANSIENKSESKKNDQVNSAKENCIKSTSTIGIQIAVPTSDLKIQTERIETFSVESQTNENYERLNDLLKPRNEVVERWLDTASKDITKSFPNTMKINEEESNEFILVSYVRSDKEEFFPSPFIVESGELCKNSNMQSIENNNQTGSFRCQLLENIENMKTFEEEEKKFNFAHLSKIKPSSVFSSLKDERRKSEPDAKCSTSEIISISNKINNSSSLPSMIPDISLLPLKKIIDVGSEHHNGMKSKSYSNTILSINELNDVATKNNFIKSLNGTDKNHEYLKNEAILTSQLNSLNNNHYIEDELDTDNMSVDTEVQTIIRNDRNLSSCSPCTISINSEYTITSDNTTDNKEQYINNSARTEALRKLLTEDQRAISDNAFIKLPNTGGAFNRNGINYRSCRTERSKPDHLDYITQRHTRKNDFQAESSTPAISMEEPSQDTALKKMVILKKSIMPNQTPDEAFESSCSALPYPIPAYIPRPKYFTKYSSLSTIQIPETTDEEVEASDLLTPLRSEMRPFPILDWRINSDKCRDRNYNSILNDNSENNNFDNQLYESYVIHEDDEYFDNDNVDNDAFKRSSSRSSTEEGTQSDATYETSETESNETKNILFENDDENVGHLKLSDILYDALTKLNNEINSKAIDSFDNLLISEKVSWTVKIVRHEWLKLTTQRTTNALFVDAFVNEIAIKFSPLLMKFIVNITDQNGNTALHYAVSQENYNLVSKLLDTKVCSVDMMNRAGYSAVMLGALCNIENETESAIVHRLFHIGDVNAKALKHSQTALMLAASHGRIKTTELLLSCGADVNMQDVDGSTALMCAAEHGQKEVVKILLNHSNIDASITDCDNQTALSIAVENQHRDIAIVIYAHLNFNVIKNCDKTSFI